MKTLREYFEEIDESLGEGSMSAAEHHRSGAHFGGYYGATQKGPPRPGQGVGGCEESVDPDRESEEEPLEEDDDAARVIELADEMRTRE